MQDAREALYRSKKDAPEWEKDLEEEKENSAKVREQYHRKLSNNLSSLRKVVSMCQEDLRELREIKDILEHIKENGWRELDKEFGVI